MRIRLGLLNQDLADRFCISLATCSNIFKTWIRFLSETLGNLVQWLPHESVQENMPKVFKKTGYGKVRLIIDCKEVFIERSKSFQTQALTWSDYKSHNTIKFLIEISPTVLLHIFQIVMVDEPATNLFAKTVGFLSAWILTTK